MSEDSELWACHFKKTCGWQGPKSAIALKPNPGGFGQVSACPRCGQTKRGFAVTKDNAVARIEAENKRQQRIASALKVLTHPAAIKMAHQFSAS